MSKLDKDTVLDAFTQAYTKAKGNAPAIEAKGGWFSVDGGKNVRLAQLEEMTAELTSAKPAKKTATKPVVTKEPVAKKETAPEKAPVAKKTVSKKSVAKTFSVKDFYTQQIIDANPGAIAPR